MVGRVLAAFLVVLGALSAALFWVQNSSRVTQLSFDAGVAAWELSQPIPIPVLVAVCLAAGFFFGAGVTWWMGRARAPVAPNSDAASSW